MTDVDDKYNAELYTKRAHSKNLKKSFCIFSDALEKDFIHFLIFTGCSEARRKVTDKNNNRIFMVQS